VILAPSGCCLPRCAPGLSRTGSREAEPTTNNRLSIPSPAHLPRERTSERSPVLGRTKSRRVQNAKASRGALGVHALARSLARGALEESQPLSYHTLRLTPGSVNLDSAPLLRGVLSTDFPAKIDQRRAVSSTPLRLLDLPWIFFFFSPLLMNFHEIKHPQSVS